MNFWKWLKGPSKILKGTRFRTHQNRYKARDGFYYNGYMFSPDASEDCFGEAWKKIANNLKEELNKLK